MLSGFIFYKYSISQKGFRRVLQDNQRRVLDNNLFGTDFPYRSIEDVLGTH